MRVVVIVKATKDSEEESVPLDGPTLRPTMQYLVIETFRDQDPVPVYRRFRDHGRLAPDGLTYVGSWVTADLARCYQVMECADREVLERWMARWRDLIDFEVFPVLSSGEVQAQLVGRL